VALSFPSEELVDTGASGAIQQGRSVSLSSDGRTATIGGPGDSGGQGAAEERAKITAFLEANSGS
jgi:hypothetical protein